jgi:hypothetical protein
VSTLDIDLEQAIVIFTSLAVLALVVERLVEILSDIIPERYLPKPEPRTGSEPTPAELANEEKTRKERRPRLLGIALVLGILVAFLLQVRIFGDLGFAGYLGAEMKPPTEGTPEAPLDAFFKSWARALDTIVTGLLIGGGSDPLHQIVRKLQDWRN